MFIGDLDQLSRATIIEKNFARIAPGLRDSALPNPNGNYYTSHNHNSGLNSHYSQQENRHPEAFSDDGGIVIIQPFYHN
jgi:hypothetical protein